MATVVVAQMILLPLDAEWVADSALWSLVSLANVYFWQFQDLSYFASDSKELPLLHLWSLGVEEQFYFIWPLLLLMIGAIRRPRLLVICIVAIIFGSFALGELAYDQSPMFAYYMLPSRAGELLFGALVAVATIKNAGRFISKPLALAIAWSGAALLVWSLFGLSETDQFPGLNAVPPTLGTALIIFAGHCRPSVLSLALSVRPVVWVGLVSYSAYLWHWPLLAFIRYGFGEVTSVAGSIAFFATFILAWITYRYVEQPVRRLNGSFGRIFATQYLVPAGALGIMCMLAMYVDGFGIRNLNGEYRGRLESIKRLTPPTFTFDFVCQKQRIGPKDLLDDRCVVGASSREPARLLMWGDSNSSHYVGMVRQFADRGGFKFRNVAVGACPPIDDDPEPFVRPARLADCRNSLRVIRPEIEKYHAVTMAASYQSYRNNPEFLDAFMRTASRLAKSGKLVIVLGKNPVLDHFDHLCRQKSISFPMLNCVNVRNRIGPDIAKINLSLRNFASGTDGVEYFDANALLCPEGLCSAYASDGKPIYHDSDHITMGTSRDLGRKVLETQGLPAPFKRVLDHMSQAVWPAVSPPKP